MIVENITNYKRGWFIGNFEPSILKTEGFEVGILNHKKGEDWPAHYHAQATEYNVLLEGSMKIGGHLINEGDIFVIHTYEIAEPEFLTDCRILVVKTPSVIGDKFNV